MKQTPILFSTPMVQAILAGRKTQTRRVVKDKMLQENTDPETEEYLKLTTICPYGYVGDVLWVRETFAKRDTPDAEWNPKWGYCYKADNDPLYEHKKFKPSIHMPKEACRVWLRVTNLRIERLHDISESDSIKEGVEFEGEQPWYKDYVRKLKFFPFANPFYSFRSLWKSINGDDSWNANPWVWVVQFEVVSTTGKEGIKG